MSQDATKTEPAYRMRLATSAYMAITADYGTMSIEYLLI